MPPTEQRVTQPDPTPAAPLSRVSRHPVEAVCIHPTCTNSCEYRVGTRGQKRLFCSAKCNLDYHTTRNNLLKEISDVDERIETVGPRSHDGRILSQQRKHLTWHLRRYGG